MESSGNIRRSLVQIIRYFGECIGDKTVEDFKGILGDSQEKSWESLEKSGGNIRDIANKSLIFLFV